MTKINGIDIVAIVISIVAMAISITSMRTEETGTDAKVVEVLTALNKSDLAQDEINKIIVEQFNNFAAQDELMIFQLWELQTFGYDICTYLDVDYCEPVQKHTPPEWIIIPEALILEQ